MYKVERINGDRYYRGVYIFKNGAGYSYRVSQRTDRFCRSDVTCPYKLGYTLEKIDECIENATIENGTIVLDSRTK